MTAPTRELTRMNDGKTLAARGAVSSTDFRMAFKFSGVSPDFSITFIYSSASSLRVFSKYFRGDYSLPAIPAKITNPVKTAGARALNNKTFSKENDKRVASAMAAAKMP